MNTARPECRIVPFPRFLVRHACGYAHDAMAMSADAAIADVRANHDPACGGEWAAMPYREGPHA